MTTKCKSALIVGGGIVGLTCALKLLRQGLRTTIVSQTSATRPASWGNAGRIAVEQVEPLASRQSITDAIRCLVNGSGTFSAPLGDIRYWAPFFLRVAQASGNARLRMGTAALTACMQRTLPAWRALLQDIRQPRLLVENGHFVVWESARTAKAGRTRLHASSLGPVSFRTATAEEMDRLDALSGKKLAGAVRFDGTAQVTDPGVLLDSLQGAFAAAGGDINTSWVQTLAVGKSGQATVTTDDGNSHTADAIVIAAGVDSGRLLRQTGCIVPIVAERGYHIQSAADAWPDDMPSVFFEDRAMVVTHFLTALRATGFVEFARHDRPPTEAKWITLQKHVAELGLPFRPPVSKWMGARPTLPDYLPAIGKSPDASNLYYAFGHQHLGLTMAAVTAELVADRVFGRPSEIDLRPFDIARFSN